MITANHKVHKVDNTTIVGNHNKMANEKTKKKLRLRESSSSSSSSSSSEEDAIINNVFEGEIFGIMQGNGDININGNIVQHSSVGGNIVQTSRVGGNIVQTSRVGGNIVQTSRVGGNIVQKKGGRHISNIFMNNGTCTSTYIESNGSCIINCDNGIPNKNGFYYQDGVVRFEYNGKQYVIRDGKLICDGEVKKEDLPEYISHVKYVFNRPEILLNMTYNVILD